MSLKTFLEFSLWPAMDKFFTKDLFKMKRKLLYHPENFRTYIKNADWVISNIFFKSQHQDGDFKYNFIFPYSNSKNDKMEFTSLFVLQKRTEKSL